MKKKECMVTDCEAAFRNAIMRYLPGMPLFRCWKHFFSSTEAWVKKNGGQIVDVRFYNDSLRQILLQSSAELASKQIALCKER